MSWRHGVFFSQWNSSISCHAIFKTKQKIISVIFWLVEIDQSGSRLTNQWDYLVSKCSNMIGSEWGILIACWVAVIFLYVEIDQSGSGLIDQWDYLVSKCSNIIGSKWGILISCWVGVGLAFFVSCDPRVARFWSHDLDNGDCHVLKIEIPCVWVALFSAI